METHSYTKCFSEKPKFSLLSSSTAAGENWKVKCFLLALPLTPLGLQTGWHSRMESLISCFANRAGPNSYSCTRHRRLGVGEGGNNQKNEQMFSTVRIECRVSVRLFLSNY